MQRFLLPLVASLLGAFGGVIAAQKLAPGTTPREIAGEGRDDGLREQVAELLRRLAARPDLAPAPTPAPSPSAAPAPTGNGPGLGAAEVEALAQRLVDAMEDRRLAREKTEQERARARRVRRPLADVAREIQLTAAEETDVRRAYDESVERMLKLMAEPESDAETLRRELSAVKGDPAKRMATVTRYLPKFVSKLGEVMAIEAERGAKLVKAIGAEKAAKLVEYELEEEDPFGLDGQVSVGVSAGD